VCVPDSSSDFGSLEDLWSLFVASSGIGSEDGGSALVSSS